MFVIVHVTTEGKSSNDNKGNLHYLHVVKKENYENLTLFILHDGNVYDAPRTVKK